MCKLFALLLLLPLAFSARGALAAENEVKEIPITEVAPVRIGQTENAEAGTGCTVFICPEGMRAGIDVRGGGPASREIHLLNPLTAAQSIHAIVLAGGSAFGLGTAGGVMKLLEERGIGFDVGITKVPLVAQSDIFDLTVGDAFVRPDEAMGYEAARRALDSPDYRDGNYGAGCGATVGKIAGMETCMKTGIGSYAMQIGELKIGAVVVLNALGDVFDWKSGAQIAGLLSEDKSTLRRTDEYMKRSVKAVENKFTGNTTLAVVITNARFDKAKLCKIAGMAHNGYARSIKPVHTSADGDTIYAVSAGEFEADQDLVGTLAAESVSEAIIRAVTSAESAYGFTAAADLKR
ncbi:MAG: P1 family peptidase [Pyramidobacter sp.]|jgi:L-aminopeptidase/D-esterase-like protein|nr:P1 family peptidase [Pyramidobacter sp.]